jgi:hypothetical protein
MNSKLGDFKSVIWVYLVIACIIWPRKKSNFDDSRYTLNIRLHFTYISNGFKLNIENDVSIFGKEWESLL